MQVRNELAVRNPLVQLEGNEHSGKQSAETPLVVDLHGLHPTEALQFLNIELRRCYAVGATTLTVITGTGHHAWSGTSSLLLAVKSELTSQRLQFMEVSKDGRGGCLTIRLKDS
jgi:DNA-nicking Smr family endonuclease